MGTPYFDSEAESHALELLSTSDAMLMGRRTYEFFAAAFPHRTGEYGDRVNRISKYVFSSTLKKADWSNSSILEGDVAAEVAKLKAQVGKDLVIYGHGLLGQTSRLNDFIFSPREPSSGSTHALLVAASCSSGRGKRQISNSSHKKLWQQVSSSLPIRPLELKQQHCSIRDARVLKTKYAKVKRLQLGDPGRFLFRSRR